jgi:hypothetical protein
MEWLCGGLCALAVLGIAGIAVLRRRDERRFQQWGSGRPTSAVCIHCHGRGWVQHTRRTLEFTGEAFANEAAPQTQCEICGGAGRVAR